MKDEIKKLLLIFSIIYSIIIIVLISYSYNTSINTMEFNDDEENIETLNYYKNELNNIEESACKNEINKLINYYEKTSYNGNVNLKDKYMNEIGIIDYGASIIDSCHLSNSDRNKLGLKLISAAIQFDEVLELLRFQYEIRIPDLNNRSTLEIDLNTIRYNINRKNQLEIIEILIDNLKEGKEYE